MSGGSSPSSLLNATRMISSRVRLVMHRGSGPVSLLPREMEQSQARGPAEGGHRKRAAEARPLDHEYSQ